MEFCVQLSSDYPDKAYGGDRVYRDMLDQAQLADGLGFDAVSITEHHLVNCLMMPAPLTFAVKIAAHTQQIKILTSVVVLPLHDMRTYAGEVVVLDDKEVDAQVVELLGPSAQLIFPCDSRLPHLVLQLKHIGKYCGLSVEIVDHKRQKRRFHLSNNQSKIHITSHDASVPLELKENWNYLNLDLVSLTKNAFGTRYQRAICVQIFSSCRVWRVFLQKEKYSDVELPMHLRTL